MILIAAVDDAGGMMFNRRRQSQDRILREKILSLTGGGVLWMNAYTAGQFPEGAPVQVDEACLDRAGAGEYCLIENLSAKSHGGEIEKLILFHWNRRYPGDFFFDIDVTAPGWALLETEEFPGSSHEKITMEVYAHA